MMTPPRLSDEPWGERIARLERGEESTVEDIKGLSDKMDVLQRQLDRIERQLSERRGVDRVSGMLLDVAKVVGGGVVTLIGQHWFGGH